MKKYLYAFLLFIFISFTFNTLKVNGEEPLNNKIIVIDAGHGDKDPGTSYKDIYEKDINLNISKYLSSSLKKYGANVIMTRTGDYDLSSPNAYFRKKSDFDNRISLINESNATIYISIHLNYLNNSKYYGPQVFYDQDNESLAKSIQKSLNDALKTDRGAKRIPSDTYMYSRLKIPGILIECGFLSNEYERNLLVTKKYQKKIASIIADAIKTQNI